MIIDIGAHTGDTTVPMAVAASSAISGFFPPLELNGWDVRADESELTRHGGAVSQFSSRGTETDHCFSKYNSPPRVMRTCTE